MSVFQRFRYIFLGLFILLMFLAVTASVTVYMDITPLNLMTLSMLGYCFGVGTISFIIFLRLQRGYIEAMKRHRQETIQQAKSITTKKPEKEKEAEY
jgi:predicted RND superfamily exporter protein